jgi:hypothetical protein
MFAKKVLGDSIGRNRMWGSHPRPCNLKECTIGMNYMLAIEIAELFLGFLIKPSNLIIHLSKSSFIPIQIFRPSAFGFRLSQSHLDKASHTNTGESFLARSD